MNARKLKLVRRTRRKRRSRRLILGTPQRPRLTVFRSHRHIGAQLIDDLAGVTLCAAATNNKTLADQVKRGSNCQAATLVGQLLAERARMKGIKEVAFDRNGYKYHGRVKALADAARKTGLVF
jgi:large subunit ribosomal protein L18